MNSLKLYAQIKATKLVLKNKATLKQMLESYVGHDGIVIYHKTCQLIKELAETDKKADKMMKTILKVIAELIVLYKNGKIKDSEWNFFFERLKTIFREYHDFVEANGRAIGLARLDFAVNEFIATKYSLSQRNPLKVEQLKCKTAELLGNISKSVFETIGREMRGKTTQRLHKLAETLTRETVLVQLSDFGSDSWKLISEIDDHVQGVIHHQLIREVESLPRIDY